MCKNQNSFFLALADTLIHKLSLFIFSQLPVAADLHLAKKTNHIKIKTMLHRSDYFTTFFLHIAVSAACS